MTVLTLEQIAEQIQQEHDQAMAGMRTGLEHACNAGRLLLEAKKLRKGRFLAWVEVNCPFGERTAQYYIKVANNWDTIKEHMDSEPQWIADLTAAIKLLAKRTGATTSTTPTTESATSLDSSARAGTDTPAPSVPGPTETPTESWLAGAFELFEPAPTSPAAPAPHSIPEPMRATERTATAPPEPTSSTQQVGPPRGSQDDSGPP